MTIEEIKRSINGEIFDLKMFEIVCNLSLFVDDLTDEERHNAECRYGCITILQSKNGGYYLYLKSYDEEPIAQQAHFWEAVRDENNQRKEHNQNLINYNIDKIRFFREH